MKNLLLIFLTIILQLPYTLKGQNYHWAKGIGGKGASGGGTITTDSLGNIYQIGFFNDTVDFDLGPGIFKLKSTSTNGDTYILKLDSLANFVWVKKFGCVLGGGNLLQSKFLTLDKSQNILITGFFTGTVDFDPGPGVTNITSVGTGYNSFILKLDPTGNLIWVKSIGNYLTSVFSMEIKTTKQDQIYFTGSFQSYSNQSVDFDPGPSVYNMSPLSQGDIYICKLNSAGDFIWAKSFPSVSNGTSYGMSLELDAQNNVYTTGHYSGTTDFNPGAGVFNLTAVSGDDIFISKLDSLGNFIWAKGIGGIGSEMASCLTIDDLGNVLTTGFYQSTIDFDPGIGIDSLSSIGSDIFVLKLDPNGNYIWCKSVGGPGPNSGTSISTDRAGNIYTTGGFTATIDFNPGPAVYTLTCTGYWDMFVFKLDPSGNYVWAKSVQGRDSTSFSPGNSIHVTNKKEVYISGQYYNKSDFNTDLGLVTLSPFDNRQSYILKLGKCNISLNTATIANICLGESFTLTANGATNYTWAPISNSGSSVVINPTTNTTYTLVGALAPNCKETQTVSVIVDPCTGINQNSVIENVIKVYPNPNNGDFIVTYTEALNIKLVNELGQVLRIIELNDSNAYSTRISNLAAGVYFLSSEKGTLKIIVTM